jgi:cytochrome P450
MDWTARGPVFWEPELEAWVVTRRADVLAVLADPGTFSSADSAPTPPGAPHGHPWTPPALVNADPPGHTALRKLVNRAFQRPRIAALEPGVQTLAAELVAGLAPRGRAEVIGELARPLAERSLARAVGYPEEELDALRRWLDELDATLEGTGDPVVHAGFAERCAAPAAALAGGPPETAVSAFLQVLMAGVATTAHTIAHAVRLALEHPEAPREPAALVEETLRHTPTVRTMLRRATCDADLDGARIRRGDRVLAVLAAANRDAGFVADGDAFRPGRPDGRDHLAFGRGAHFCLGAPLARVEARAALAALLALPGLRLAAGQRLEPYPAPTIHAYRELHVEWDA